MKVKRHASVFILNCIFKTKDVRSKVFTRLVTCPSLSAITLISQTGVPGELCSKNPFPSKLKLPLIISFRLLFSVIMRDVPSKVSARDVWFTRPTLFAKSLHVICQPAFFATPFWNYHMKSCFASVISIKTKVVHSRNKLAHLMRTIFV